MEGRQRKLLRPCWHLENRLPLTHTCIQRIDDTFGTLARMLGATQPNCEPVQLSEETAPAVDVVLPDGHGWQAGAGWAASPPAL